MIGSFSFNGVESSTFGLVCKSVKRPLLPAAKVNRIEIPGASGAHDFEDDSYELRSVTMQIAYIGTSYEELRARARQIAAWLANNTWSRLIINDEPDKYYLAKVTSEIDLQSLWESGSADITFDCQPFAYSIAEVTFTQQLVGADVETNYVFSNPGTRKIDFRSPPGSKFNITVTGSWTLLSFVIGNGEKVLYYGYAGNNSTLVLNNVDMEITQDGENTFSMLDGDIDTFLSIDPGINTLGIGATDADITVTVEFIPLWM
jgi:predicted phage tail component-like protein